MVNRLRRIRGQTEALERAVAEGTDCGHVLQQLAALRGAATGLMADVLQSHLQETFGTPEAVRAPPPNVQEEIELVGRIVKSYLK